MVVIDIQTAITNYYKELIDNINKAIEGAGKNKIPVVSITHEHVSAGAKSVIFMSQAQTLLPV